jgi:hypothetical protein
LPDLPSNNSPMTVPTIGEYFQEIRARLLARDNMIREISVWIKAWGLSSSQTYIATYTSTLLSRIQDDFL